MHALVTNHANTNWNVHLFVLYTYFNRNAIKKRNEVSVNLHYYGNNEMSAMMRCSNNDNSLSGNGMSAIMRCINNEVE